MSAPNGHSKVDASIADHRTQFGGDPAILRTPEVSRFSGDDVKRLVTELEIPFEPRLVQWRVTNTSHDKTRGQVIPYADQRAYSDRLNALFTPAGWTRRYTIHTSANFQRSQDQKIVAKVLVTCELSIFGIGTHSATGEEWADDDNAGTSAEAQAFKRACSCFGLGRYLYNFVGIWVDLDERRRPKDIPSLPKWASPAGWIEGHRTNNGPDSQRTLSEATSPRSLVSEIEEMAQSLGRGLYRGLLRDLAKVWNPNEIREYSLQQKVLEHMRAAERGLVRLQAAVEKTGCGALNQVLRSLAISTLERVDKLDTLKRVVIELEHIADCRQ